MHKMAKLHSLRIDQLEMQNWSTLQSIYLKGNKAKKEKKKNIDQYIGNHKFHLNSPNKL